MISDMPVMLTVNDLATLLRVSVRTVWRLRSAGTLPKPVEIGGSVRWDPEIIRTWMAGGCQATAGRENVSGNL